MWNWLRLLGLVALALSAAGRVFAQTLITGALSGKITNLNSSPLPRVALIARNQATGAVMRTITGKNGAYRFAALDPGEYSLEAESSQLGQGRLDNVEVTSGHESRVQAAMEFRSLAPASGMTASLPMQLPTGHVIQADLHFAVAPAEIAAVLPVEPMVAMTLESHALPALPPESLQGATDSLLQIAAAAIIAARKQPMCKCFSASLNPHPLQ